MKRSQGIPAWGGVGHRYLRAAGSWAQQLRAARKDAAELIFEVGAVRNYEQLT
jgi:hypothetical protein